MPLNWQRVVTNLVQGNLAKTKTRSGTAEKGKTDGALSLTLFFPLSSSDPPSLSLSFRYKNVERLAAEEYERERVRAPRTRPDLNLTFEPTEAWPSSSRSSTPSSFASQEDAEADLEVGTPTTPFTPSETGRTTENTVYMALTNNMVSV